jgi:Tfp pilus assembly protein PilO
MMTEAQWKQVAIVAVVVAVLALALDLALPRPKRANTARYAIQENQALRDLRAQRDEVSELRKQNALRLWTAQPDEIAAQTMAATTRLANERELKVVSFRPQRPLASNDLSLLPYQLTVEGGFAQVVQFLQALETKGLKLTVNLVQVASADGASDRVNATVGIVAYTEGEQKKS